MNLKTIVAILVIAIMACTASAERITEDVEIRGEIMTGAGLAQYDYQNAAMFWYELNSGLTSETMNVTVTGTRTVAPGDLVYKCIPQNIKYENPDLGNYIIMGWQAEKYVCYDGKSDKLVKLLIEWDSNDDKVLSVGESLEMPEGYTIIIKEIDLEGGKCYLTLYKDGIGLDSEIVTDNTTYKYFDDDDVLVCSIKIANVFRGTDSNLVIVEYLYLQSEKILDIDSGDNFGIMEVVGTSNGIKLENDDSFDLNEDDEIEIMGNLYFKVADDPLMLRYYLAKVVSLECDECPTCPELNQTACPECPICEPEIVEVEIINETIRYVEVPADPVNESPGFGAILPLVGLLGIAYLIARQRD